jgi:hypothetical protein
LLEVSRSAHENADRVLALVHQHGTEQELDAMRKSMQRLANSSSVTITTLSEAGKTGVGETGELQEKSAGASTSN